MEHENQESHIDKMLRYKELDDQAALAQFQGRYGDALRLLIESEKILETL